MRTVSSILSGVPPLFADLAQLLTGDIDCTGRAITDYSTDGSPYRVYPQAILYPKNATDIKYIVSFAREYRMPITVRGGGTSRNGGSLGEGIIIDLTRYFTHIRQINMMEHTITVDAGVSIKTLREKLHGWHVDVPALTHDDELATLGGLLATKSATPSSFHHGTIREWVEALTVVVDTGEEHRIADGITPSGRLLGIYQAVFPILTEGGPILRAAKPEMADDATGYSLWNTTIGPRQLLDELVGSEGTLGIITSVTLRLSPYKEHSVTTLIPVTDTSLLTSCLEIARHHNAEHIFLYDSTFKDLANKYHAGLIPISIDTPYTLLITHRDTDKEKVHSKVRTFIRALPIKEELITHRDDTLYSEHIATLSFCVSLCDAYTGGTHIPITTGDGIIVPLHHYGVVLNELDTYLSHSGRLYTITGNAGSGHIRIITLFDKKSSTLSDDIRVYNETIFSCVKKHRGGISAVGGEGLARTPYLSYVYNESMRELFMRIKSAWDPHMIFNPNKKLSVTTQYLHDHLT